MTYQNNFTLSAALLDQLFLEQLTTSGLDDVYNVKRLHSSLGYLPPTELEANLTN